jgi:Tol biopolymer transport system component
MKWLAPLSGFFWLLPALGVFASDEKTQGEARFLSNARQLIFEGRRSGEGYFSPDGKALIFQSEREPGNPFYQIYILDLTSGQSHRVSPGLGKTTCAFFRPGSDEVMFSSTHLDPEAREKQKAELEFRAAGKERRYSWDYDEHMDIFVARREGGNVRRLTDAPGYDAEGSYSPDGSKIVFSSIRDAYPRSKLGAEDAKRLSVDPSYFAEIYLMNADGSGQKRLTFTPGYDGGPFFSPDGERILWRRFDENGMNADVYTMKLDGSDVRRLTEFGSMAWAPYFHPTGEYVIFTSNKLGFENFELFLVDARGERQPVRVTFTDGFDGLPVFSPDGAKLCWTSSRTADRQAQLFLADWNHQAASEALQAAPLRGATHGAPEGASPAAPTEPAARLSPAATREEFRRLVEMLAADELEGRRTGAEGARRAAELLAESLKAIGLQPAGEGGSFFQTYDFNAGSRVIAEKNRLTVVGAGEERAFEVEKDFRPLSLSANDTIEGEVVFAGYGLFVPGAAGTGYDSYSGMDVSGKTVLVLRYVPESVEPRRRQELNRYAGLRYKAMLARERGAKALLVVTGPNSPNAGELVPLSFDTSLSGSGIVAASVSGRVAEAILKAAGKDLAELQTALDSENPHAPGGFLVPQVRVQLTTALERIRKSDRNVLAYLPPAAAGAAPEEILIGAHYDHLGRGDEGSLQRKGEEGQIHNGADDNASGTALALNLAGALAAERQSNPQAFRRGIRFAFWSGEELGLLGSSHYAEKMGPELSRTVAYLNFDMVGRLRDNKLSLQGVGSSSGWKALIEKRNVAAGFDLVLQEDPYLPTDVTALYPKKVPAINFFTGGHEDYHRPTDDADKINYQGMTRISELARRLVLDLAASPERLDYVAVAPSSTGGSRETLRAYVGTIPDYTSEVSGVKLSGVRAGGPAEKAGLKAGDVIVRFGEQAITNIYDYTFALDAVKIGQPVEVEVLRDGERLKLQIVPEARK